MKKLIIFAFVFLLLIQLVQAGEIFDDEVQDNIPFTISGIEHIARYYPAAEKVSLLAGDDRVLVAIEDCEELNDLKYCFDSAVEGVADETGDPASTMQLRVLESGPEITIDRSISDDEPDLEEEIEVIVTLSNVGNERAANVNYEDKFPTGIKISSAYQNLATNSIVWTGSISAGDSQTIKYKLTFKDFITYESIAKASFVYNNKANKVESSKVTYEVQKPYKVSDSISSRSVDINEEITYTININNTDATQELIVKNVEVTVPEGAIVSHRDMGWDLIGGTVTYSGEISGGDSESLSFRFKSSKETEGTLSATIDLNVGLTKFTEEFSHKIGMGVSAIMPEITFNPATVKGGGELEIEAKIVNQGEETVSEISLDMSGDIVEPRGWRKLELEPGKKHYAFNKIINAPASDMEKVYSLKLSGSYETASGKTMDFELEEEVIVLPQEKLVELLPEITLEGKEANVTLNIKNIAPYKVTHISLIDTIPKGFKATEGSRYIDIEELAIGEERVQSWYPQLISADLQQLKKEKKR
jgi:hypothetical protein